jgi:hypothetical protein
MHLPLSGGSARITPEQRSSLARAMCVTHTHNN